MKTYHRYDLCPNCSTRLDMKQFEVDDREVRHTLLISGKVERAVLCGKCDYLYTKLQILDHWSEYYVTKGLD
jgi:hypothetical protein